MVADDENLIDALGRLHLKPQSGLERNHPMVLYKYRLLDYVSRVQGGILQSASPLQLRASPFSGIV